MSSPRQHNGAVVSASPNTGTAPPAANRADNGDGTAAKVRVFYPADPVGVVPGGIDTFIRGIVKWAPPDLQFSVVGMTTDPVQRPVGRWTQCEIGHRTFDFYPVVATADAGGRGKVPLSLRYTAAAWRHAQHIRRDFDVFDFHRVEPSLLFNGDPRPKNAYFHQDPQTIANAASDNLWRRLPGGYQRIEARAVGRLTSAWCVRESGVQTLRGRYPLLAEQIRFVPTWVDPDNFSPAGPVQRRGLRRMLAAQRGLDAARPWIVSVGRLDTQKNPALLLGAFARLCAGGHDADLLLIGDGVLRRMLERTAQQAGIRHRVHFLGLQAPDFIADVLRAADLFAMSSAYEGMPMALLEALGCGTPAVVTDVGEARRVVHHGHNGLLVTSHDEAAFEAALSQGLAAGAGWRAAAVTAVAPYQPAQVLRSVYDNYWQLARGFRLLRHRAMVQTALQNAPPAPETAGRLRRAAVMDAPIDPVDADTLDAQIMRWARRRESRYACFCNVHSAVLAARDESHRLALIGADAVVPDGAPVAWTMRRKGHRAQLRITGPDTMWRLCGMAAADGVNIGLYGSTPAVLAALRARLAAAFPELRITYSVSPPFRDATAAEDDAVCDDIARACVGLLFVGLGCPKQERWMAQHRGRVPAVMLGLGAAFDFHAGTAARAPALMRDHGLEWLHRLASEPRRLGWRYVVSNTAFIASTLRFGARAPEAEQRQTPPATHIEGSTMHENRRLPPSIVTVALDSRPIRALTARIDAVLMPAAPRIVGFIASGAGEGTSTVARNYARASARNDAGDNTATTGRRVLLVSSLQPSAGDAGALGERPLPLSQLAVLARLAAPAALQGNGLYVTRPAIGVDGDRAWGSLAQSKLWTALRTQFDLIVLDLPATSTASAGMQLAPLCDGVVVVLEAERTRAAVAANLIENLLAVRARLLGTVLNKRRFLLPARLYRWL